MAYWGTASLKQRWPHCPPFSGYLGQQISVRQMVYFGFGGRPRTRVSLASGPPSPLLLAKTLTHSSKGVTDVSEPPQDSRAHSEVDASTKALDSARAWDNWALGLGIASIFLGGMLGLLPIVTFGVGLFAVTRPPNPRPGFWKGVAGLILGALYFLVYLNNFGYLG